MNLDWLLGWWNLVFVAPFFVALIYLGVMTISGLGIGDADAHGDVGTDADVDADADADIHANVDADVDADADLDADADADADHDISAEADQEAEGSHASGGSTLSAALSWLGVGRVPISLLVTVLLLIWGVAGFITNVSIRPAIDWQAAQWSLPIAAFVSLLSTKLIAGFTSRFMPLNETYARPRKALTGSVGEAIYDIDEKFGMVSVRNGRGDLHQVECRVAEEMPSIRKGQRVRLVAYSEKARMFYVAPIDEPGRAGSSTK